MLLVCDVGNTNLVFGIYEKESLKYSFRLSTDPLRTSDEYGMFVKMLIEHEGYSFKDVDDVIISSVVPEVMHSLENFALKFCKFNSQEFLKFTTEKLSPPNFVLSDS